MKWKENFFNDICFQYKPFGSKLSLLLQYNFTKKKSSNMDTDSNKQNPKKTSVINNGNIDKDHNEKNINNSINITDTKVSTQNVLSDGLEKSPTSSAKKSSQSPNNANGSNSNPSRKSKRRRNSDTSSDEERWLTAIESGKLEQVEVMELKRIKDPKFMTARQRAIYDRNNDNEIRMSEFDESLIALPIGYKEREKPQTTEEIQKAQLKLQKRKQLADEKRERDKEKTMQRLLKKQESKHKSINKPTNTKNIQPVIRYRHTLKDGSIIQMPPGMDFPLKAQSITESPKIILCAMAGCGRRKIYNCSKTNLPLCSYECYRKNVLSLKEIMC